MPKCPSRSLLLSRQTLSDDELRIEQARFDRLLARYVNQYAPPQQPQIKSLITQWAHDVAAAPPSRSRRL
jgi:hypothetical protein